MTCVLGHPMNAAETICATCGLGRRGVESVPAAADVRAAYVGAATVAESPARGQVPPPPMAPAPVPVPVAPAAPVISPDGHWRWDGAAWQPNALESPAPLIPIQPTYGSAHGDPSQVMNARTVSASRRAPRFRLPRTRKTRLVAAAAALLVAGGAASGIVLTRGSGHSATYNAGYTYAQGHVDDISAWLMSYSLRNKLIYLQWCVEQSPYDDTDRAKHDDWDDGCVAFIDSNWGYADGHEDE